MGTPVDLYVYPGIAINFQVLSKITMTPLGPGDTIPTGAITVPPPAPAPAAAAAMAHAVMANLAESAAVAEKAVTESVHAQEAAYLAAAPVFTVGPTGQTTGPK